MGRPVREPVEPGQESVWDFPRPAIAQPTASRIVVVLGGRTVADTQRAIRTIETSHPPTYYLPLGDIDRHALRPGQGRSVCEWKGVAIYHDVVAGAVVRPGAAWFYPHPTRAFAAIRDHVAFYAAAMDACFVDGERVVAQPGGFYGGWITSSIAGPFKGVPGSMGW